MNASRLRWCAAAAGVLAIGPCLMIGADGNADGGKVLVRPKYEPGLALRYNLKLSGATAWTPAPEGVHWGKMSTDLTAVLATKVIRDSGACTFNLLGERLTSSGQGPKGAVRVDATREKVRLTVNGKRVTGEKGPLARPMTMTFGPRGAHLFGTGLAPIAIYMLPHVDRRFWTLLTVAPLKEVAPGEEWSDEFDLPVPGGKGRPLKLKGRWKVLGWQSYQRRKVLAMSLAAELTLGDSDLMLKNGDVIHVTSGTYKADGKVMWDVAEGRLCFAEAAQKLLVRADRPIARALRSEARCTLSLLRAAVRAKR